MNLTYRICFHLARAIVVGPAGPGEGRRDAPTGKDLAYAHSLHGHDQGGSALQGLGGPRRDAAPLRGPRRRPQAG